MQDWAPKWSLFCGIGILFAFLLPIPVQSFRSTKWVMFWDMLGEGKAEAVLAAVTLGPRGVCLVMGHPHLGPVLNEVLGGGWALLAAHDVTREDLAPWLDPDSP